MGSISRSLNVTARGSAQVPNVLSACISEEPSLAMRTCNTPSTARICYVSGALVITRT